MEEKEENIWRRKICFFFAEEKNNREGKGGSFARGRSIQMIICKRLVDPYDHLQEPVHLDDHLQEAGPSG